MAALPPPPVPGPPASAPEGGYSLVEVVVVTAVIGALASLAYNGYRN